MRIFWAVYALFIVYGTLIPFNFGDAGNFQHRIHEMCLIPFLTNEGTRTSISDIVQNVMLFAPFGFFGAFSLIGIKNSLIKVIVVLFSGMATSCTVEVLQLFSTDRVTSITDVVTNTTGTLVGIVAAGIIGGLWAEASSVPLIRRCLGKSDFFFVGVFGACILAELLQPFDFTLDVGSVYHHVKAVLRNPFSISINMRDDVFVCLLYGILSFHAFRLIREVVPDTGVIRFAAGAAVVVAGVECTQFIVASRSPEIGDMAVGMTGVFGGLLLYKLNKPMPTTIITAILFCVGVCGKLFSPFAARDVFAQINWVPFMAEYSRTTMMSLGNTIEAAFVFICGGILIGGIRGVSPGLKWGVVVAAGVFIPVSELLQGWIVNRYPDITDVLAAYVAFLFGMHLRKIGVKFVEKRATGNGMGVD